MAPAVVRTALSLACLAAACRAQAFRGINSVMSATELDGVLLREYGAVGGGELEAVAGLLRPMYAALPKNAHGRLGHAAVSYALRRHFQQAYGWIIQGLTPEGSDWNWQVSKPILVTEGRLPEYLQEAMEQNLRGQGMDLEALALLAHHLERVLVEEGYGWLEAAYRLAGVKTQRLATMEEVDKILDAYMMGYLGGALDLPSANVSMLEAERDANAHGTKNGPLWRQMQVWLQDVRRSAAYAHRARDNPFVGGALTFQGVERVMADFHAMFGQWRHQECLLMKGALLGAEDSRNSGRVRFSRLQSLDAVTGPESGWSFEETAEDLREIGAFDELDPKEPQVIVPNYIYSPLNCMAASSLHEVCCIDECEVLFAEVERGVGASSASPQQIAAIVGRVSSATVDAPRNLSEALVSRLHDVADRHGGQVPLYGRLFAQWMHHAFPNECSQPRTTAPALPRTPEQVLQEGEGSGLPSGSPMEQLLPWSEEEELLIPESPKGSTRWGLVVALPLLALLAATALRASPGLPGGLAKDQRLPGLYMGRGGVSLGQGGGRAARDTFF